MQTPLLINATGTAGDKSQIDPTLEIGFWIENEQL